ncbi:MAG: hypothetical protein IT221_16530 [Fluviicola sp.]|nr:hypothetical protein [Fluviicola sp.]
MAANSAKLILAPSCTETIRGATRVHIGARARAMEQQIYVGVAQTIGNAEWSLAVDINYGFAENYASPNKNQPEEGQVFNFKDAQYQFITPNEEISIQPFQLLELDFIKSRNFHHSDFYISK